MTPDEHKRFAQLEQDNAGLQQTAFDLHDKLFKVNKSLETCQGRNQGLQDKVKELLRQLGK